MSVVLRVVFLSVVASLLIASSVMAGTAGNMVNGVEKVRQPRQPRQP